MFVGEKPFACNFCNFKSHDRGSLGRHQKLLHSNVGEELKDCRETSGEDSSITLGSSDMLDLRMQPSPNDPQSNATSSSFCDDSSTGFACFETQKFFLKKLQNVDIVIYLLFFGIKKIESHGFRVR